MDKEQFSNSKPVNAIAATATISTDTTTYGAWIDTKDYRSLIIPIDAVRTTDGQIDSIGFQGANLAGQADAADLVAGENLFYPDDFPIVLTGLVHVGCIAKDRYVRLKIVTSGFTTGNIVIPKTTGFLMDSYFKPQVKESSVVADADVRMPDVTGDATTTAPKR